MCGIFVAYQTDDASQQVYQGLRRLEYRGYDSWGVASLLPNQSIKVKKKTGIMPEQSELPVTQVSIGHTRWATHGGITQLNAHPHAASDGSFVLVQNGIVENYVQIKTKLSKKGYKFISETDTEVIVRLVEEKLRKTGGNLVEAVRIAFNDLEGRNTIAVLEKQGRVIAVRNGSPLVMGRIKSGSNNYSYYLSSDELSLAKVAQEIMVIDNQEMVVIDKDGAQVGLVSKKWGEKSGQLKLSFRKIKLIDDSQELTGFDHYMIKEIFDTPNVIEKVTETEDAKLAGLAKAVQKARYVYTIGSGTAGLAAAQIAYYLRVHGGVMATSIVGAEGLAYRKLWSNKDLIIAPSQSGETADVLEVLEAAKKDGVKIASYVNMPGSMMTRISDFPFMASAGSERCVMSTKVFTSQIAFGYLLAKAVSGKDVNGDLTKASKAIHAYLNDKQNLSKLKKVAKRLVKKPSIFLLGKGQSLEIVKEGMVKIIEGTYLHAHAIPAGDLKHYAITIMEKGVPVVVAVPDDQDKTDVMSAIAQVKARRASVIALAEPGNKIVEAETTIPIPGGLKDLAALGLAVVLQLLAYYMTVELGHNVDKPRNIAKSVTVK